jgi:2'-5' RNA ligase
MRLFVAVHLPDEMKEELHTSFTGAVKGRTSGLRFPPPSNVHVTLKFLGETDEGLIPALEEALKTVAEKAGPFTMSVGGAGAFPDVKRARVVWAGVREGREKLAELAKAVENTLEPLGFEPERRPFRGHITVARVKNPAAAKAVGEIVAANEGRDFGSFEVGSFSLVKSELKPDGAVYIDVGDFPLSKGTTG